jgi:NPCBM/NEW2 domain
LVVLCWALAAGAAFAQPTFTAQSADGTAATGPLTELGKDWSVKLGGDKPATVAAGDLVCLRRPDVPLPPLPSQEQLVFFNGDRVPGHLLKLADERVTFQPPAELGADKEVSVPVAALSLLWLATPEGADHPDQVRRRLAGGKRARDTVVLRNNDAVEGIVTALDADNVSVEVEKKQVSVARERVAAIAFSTDLATPLRPKGAFARLVLASGCRVSLSSAACADGKTLTGTTLFRSAVRIPLGEVVALAVFQGRAVYLSDLKPRKVEQVPFLGVTWPFVADGSVAGRDLRTGGDAYDKGLGTHSECRLTYDVSAGYDRFEARVGLDDATGKEGSVRVKVLVDGKPQDLGADRELTARNGPWDVRVPVKGAKELTLVVEFGARGDVGDHVDWADARLVK